MTGDDAIREPARTAESADGPTGPASDRRADDRAGPGVDAGGGDGAAGGDEAAADDAIRDDAVGEGPILLFDGVCNLCNGLVDWVIERDGAEQFRFASLQSEVGRRLLERHDLPTDVLETFVLIDGEECYTKSSAALELFRRVGLPYSLLYPSVVVPRFARDRVYDFVADRRYAWFGERDSCRMPSPELTERFLE